VSARILLADDEKDILGPVEYALQQQGFVVTCVEDGDAALSHARSGNYDLLVCDIMMPGTLGTDVCRILRSEGDMPIILLTARDAEIDRVVGLELGADDYVTKPFSSAELVSRIRALLRRRELDRVVSPGTTRVLGGMRIDFIRHHVEVDGGDVQLTVSEFNLLDLLTAEPERVFTREQIMEHLWRTPYVGDPRVCDVHIANLRRKIEADPTHPTRIVTVRQVGYKFAAV
jgi:two-component system, OmpR family, response regulator RegX3